MQKYSKINAADKVVDALLALNDTHETLASQNSGTAFPTTNLVVGMKCFRTDQNKAYTLKSISPLSWVLTEDLNKDIYDADTFGGKRPADFARVLTAGGVEATTVSWDSLTIAGTYDKLMHGTNNANGPGLANYFYVDVYVYTNTNITQVAFAYTGNVITIRNRYNGTWSAWNVLNPANYAAASHAHTDLAQKNHTHTELAASNHSHTANDVGAAATSHGNHVPTTGTADNKKFLRNDNTWQDVTPANIGAAPAGHVGATGTAHGNATTSVAGFMSSADKTKLDGIASNTNNYSHSTGDGNLHVPATGTSNNGKVLTAGNTAGSLSWKNIGDLAFTQSLAENGWTKLPNGLIVQWGTVILASIGSNGNATIAVTFPIAFPNKLFSGHANVHFSGISDVNIVANITNYNTSGASIAFKNIAGSGISNIQVLYYLVGY